RAQHVEAGGGGALEPRGVGRPVLLVVLAEIVARRGAPVAPAEDRVSERVDGIPRLHEVAHVAGTAGDRDQEPEGDRRRDGAPNWVETAREDAEDGEAE